MFVLVVYALIALTTFILLLILVAVHSFSRTFVLVLFQGKMVKSIAIVPALAALGAALDLRQWGGSSGPSGFQGGSSSWSVSAFLDLGLDANP